MSYKAIFLDRDDTLIEDPGYISGPEQVKLLDGVSKALIALKALGFKLLVVSNQSGVARGIISEKILGTIHEKLKQLLSEDGAFLDGIYYCPYHPDGVVPKYRKESNCRKPNPGMLLKAAEEMDIDLANSWCIGDSLGDIEAGKRAGCKTILIDRPSHQKPSQTGSLSTDTIPDYKGVNLTEAVNIIKKHFRSSIKNQAPGAQKVLPDVSVPETQSDNIEAAQIDDDETTFQTEQSVTKETDAMKTKDKNLNNPKEEKSQISESEPDTATTKTENLLSDILGQLKSMQRAEMFTEFSIMRLFAGILQVMVLFCLIITIWFLMNPKDGSNSVFIALGFSIVLQLMSLTFYIMHGRK
ncbi:D-glycero-alpha-D-manno-heptose-1,7-bisphosphate 7-phosphatase [Planctomycetota bacterium]